MAHDKQLQFALWIAVIAAASITLTFCALTMLSWQKSVGIVLAASALAGTAVLTVAEMLRLGKAGR